MLTQVFSRLLSMSFAAMWLAVAVIALRPLLNKAPRRMILLLWALVAVRLLCPVSIESPVSLVPRPETVAQSVELPAETAAPAVIIHAERLWLVGASAMLLWGVWGDIRLRRRVRVSLPQGDNVRLCDEIDTPFVLGTLCPKIYLPSALDEDQAVYVLAHERAHIARGDHWWKPLGWLLLSVYWFHPVLWIAYILFCRDLELACDERVASSLDRDGLAAYSEALLKCSVRRGALASPVAFGETGVKTRVRAILRYRKPALRVVLSALLCVVVVGALFLTDRPAVAARITEIILPEIQPLQEDDWTIQPNDFNALPDAASEPAETPDAAAPASQTAQTAAQPGDHQAAERSPAVNSPSRTVTAVDPASALHPETAGNSTTLIAGENTGSHTDTDVNTIQNGDTTVIRLYP